MVLRSKRLSVGVVVWSLSTLGYFVYSSTARVGYKSLSTATEGAAGALLTLSLGIVCAYAFGFCGFRLLRVFTHRSSLDVAAASPVLIEFALGAGAVMLAVFLIGCLGLYHTATAFGLLALCLAGDHLEYWRALRTRWRERERDPVDPIVVFLLIALGMMSLTHNLAPPTAHDALVYHLALPARYIEEGRIHYVPGNVYGQFPQNVEMLFTLGMLLDGPGLAKLYHWMFAVLSCAAVAGLARLLDSNASRLLAAATFGSIPSVALIAGWAYVDLAVVFYTVMGLMCFLHFWESERTAWLVLAAILAGINAGCKYTGGFAALLLVCGVVVLGGLRRRSASRVVRQVGLISCLVCAAAAPWWIKNYLNTGNPLFPFAYDVFGGVSWDVERSAGYLASLKEWGGDRGWLSTLLLPWRLTMEARFNDVDNFDGVIGCAFLIGAPVVLIASWKSPVWFRIAAVAALAHVTFWSVSTRQVRFLLPTLALASALVASSLPRLHLARWGNSLLRGSLVGAFAVNVLIATVHFVHDWPLAVVLGQESRAHYLQREVPGGDYAVFEYINRELSPDSYIFFAALGNPGFLCERPYYSDAIFENHTLKVLLRSTAGPRDLFESFARRGFTHILFRPDLVLGPSADILESERQLFAEFLNQHGRMLFHKGGTFLYELRAPGAG